MVRPGDPIAMCPPKKSMVGGLIERYTFSLPDDLCYVSQMHCLTNVKGVGHTFASQ